MLPYFRLFVLVLCAATTPLFADDRQYLLGDWGGKRAELEEQGVSFESILTTEYVANVSGGVDRDQGFLGNYDLTMSVDTEKAKLWSGGTFFVYLLGDWGDDPTEFVGDLQGNSNLESPDDFKLYEAWYEHQFFEGKFALLAGLHDYNSEFDALEYAGTLRHSSFGISPDISQIGPSIFPTTAAAVRLKVQPTENWYGLAALYDGVPGDPNGDKGTQIIFGDDDGIFYAAESGFVAGEGERYYKVGIGAWYTTTEFEDFAGNSRDSNSGIYGIAEKLLWSEDDGQQGLGGFLQLGFASASRNPLENYVGGGFTYNGPFTGRDTDVLSLGVAYARNGDDYRDTDPSIESAETAIELTYRAQITPYFSLQPDIEYIVNPGTIQGTDDALVLSLRTEISM